MAIEWTQQSLSVSDVRSIVVTTIEQDDKTGEYVRELRIFGVDDGPEPPILNIDQQPPGQKLLVTLRLKTTSRDRVSISVPSLSF